MDPRQHYLQTITRRHFLRDSNVGLGALALGGLNTAANTAATAATADPRHPHSPPLPGKAKHVIYLHMAGSPPQHELFDFKPELLKHNMQPCPDDLLAVLQKERLPFINLKARRPKLLGTPYRFQPRGDSGLMISELLPHLSHHADEMAIIRSMHTDQFNHAPAQLLLYTGAARTRRPVTGSENANLPGFVVLISGGTDPSGGKSLWGSGFLPSVFQGVQCRSAGDPILFVSNPKGLDRNVRRRSLDALRKLNELELERIGDPETRTRISQYELAFRMQMSVPQVMDVTREPKHVQESYGTTPGKASFANNCLLARRLVEQGVRYVQLFDWGWDMHGTAKSNDLVTAMPKKCKEVDQPIAALLSDLKQRGLLDENLVIWSGEFGRTSLNEERNGSKFLGRDHHPHCFSMWMAGGGIKGGVTHGETDDLGYFVARDKVGVHDLQATVLHLLGFDPHRLSYRYQGLNQRLIGPEGDGHVIRPIVA